MLVLSRKVNEEIVIGEKIRVVVVEIRQNCVKLGIDAPRDVSVHRREVADAINFEEARQLAARNSTQKKAA